jgi:DNA (cytosine-5)-methyltransferase 1
MITFWNGEPVATSLTCTSNNQRMPDKGKMQMIVQPIAYNITFCDANGTRADRPNGGLYVSETDVTSTLTKAGIGTNVAQPIAFDAYNQTTSDTVAALRCAAGGVFDNAVAQPIPFDTTQITSAANYSNPKAGDPCHPLAAGAHAPSIAHSMAVRRLTPVECERLQGFPDGYTDIKLKGKPTPDGPRYKALGNSMAVPVMRWIGQRIEAVDKIK